MKKLLQQSVLLVFLLVASFTFSQNASTTEQSQFRILSDGKITVDGQIFNNFSEYFKSDYFKQAGKRCKVKWRNPENRAAAMLAQSDCSLGKTIIKNTYWPTQTWIIPVVVHVITDKYNNGYLSEQTINDQISVLNEDFRAITGTLGELGFDTKIQFELAGITRTQNENWFQDRDEENFKTQLGWDQNKYLNIYTNSASGYLGYSYLPQEDAGDVWDGLVILYEVFGGRDNGYDTYDQGRTVVHEMGHCLGLLHTFEEYGCYSGYEAGDLINDTYPESDEHYGCYETNTCGDPDNIHNYMNYTDDICMSEFTPEQGNRMICSIFNYRPQLAHLANEAPQIISSPILECNAGSSYEYQVIAQDADGDTITFSLTTAPAGMTINPNTGLVNWLPQLTDVGLHSVTISAADHYNEVIQTFTITVINPYTAPVALFTADTTNGFVPLVVKFTDQSTGDITNRQWNFGDSTFSNEQNPEHVYEQAGEFTVSLQVQGPGGSDTLTIANYITTYNQQVIANFGFSPQSGIAPLQVQFSDSSTGIITQRLWVFGDNTTSEELNPLHEYQIPGVYTVQLIVYGLANSDTLTRVDCISVLEQSPVAAFSAEPRSGVCPLLVQFADSSSGNVNNWLWNFGDSTLSTQRNPEHEYNMAGFYTVSLIVNGPGGVDTLTQVDYINVGEKAPRAYFSATPTSGKLPLTVQFADSSTGAITSWLWDFGDSTTSNSSNPVHQYLNKGLYTISLQVIGPGGSHSFTRPDYIDVQPALTVSETEEIPHTFSLKQNFPNPFNASTYITWDMPEKSDVWLAIYDMNGKYVRTLENTIMAAGTHRVLWDGKDAHGQITASGIYLAQIKCGNFKDNIKIILIK